jgi:protocatechuate 3,4-dioxygenase beta subunit
MGADPARTYKTGDDVRRSLLIAAVLAALAGLAAPGPATPAASACRPTLSQGGGPFESSNVTAPRRSRIGRGHVLSGRILGYPGCAPIRGAAVEFWQESPNGRYDRRGRAGIVTGRGGAFRFEGPVPPGDSGRPPHIHVRVVAAGYEDFVTTYVLARGERQGRITIVLASSL